MKIRWETPEGTTCEEFVALEDISSSGACVALEEPIPAGSIISLIHPKGEYKAEVRYCVFKNALYFVGVEFSNGQEWSPAEYVPSHLLQFVPRKNA
jgi:hypothetical protein